MTGLQDTYAGVSSFTSWAVDPQARVGLGLPFFDDVTYGGLGKSECAMVIAVSSVGKTTIGMNAIAANPDVPTVFFSLEMTWRSVMARLTAINTGIPSWELHQQVKRDGQSMQMLETASRYPYLLCDDSSALSTKQMSEKIKEAGSRLGRPIRLVLIDYLELMGGAGLLGKSEQVDRAAIKIRELAKDNDCSVIVLHQVGKGDGGGGHKPLGLESGRYGGHQPMEVVVGAYAPRLNPELSESEREAVKNDIYLSILKNRIGGDTNIAGTRHTLSKAGRITPWGVQAPLLPSPGFQPVLGQEEPDESVRSVLDDWED